jgi:hypothetical protein
VLLCKSMGHLMEPQALVIRAEDLPFSRVDDAIIAMNRELGYCYAMNVTSARIWELTSSAVSVNSLCESLRREFDVDHVTCLTDVLAVLSNMKENGLIRELA